MAKRNRNTASEQTFLKHAFQNESPNQTGYKQLKYDDAATVAADESGLEYVNQNVSSPSLATVSATVANSPTNPFSASYSKMNGHSNVSYRSGANSYLSSGMLNAGVASHLPNQTTPTMMGPVAGGQSSGYYAANISTGTLSANQSGHKKTLLDLSRTSGNVPSATNSPSHELIQTSHAQLISPSPCVPPKACSSWACDGIRDQLTSLALCCILSLLMAFLALFFLQKSCPMSLWTDESITAMSNISKSQRITGPTFNQRLVSNAKEYMRVFQISVCLSTLTIALNLCCLFVCSIQFLSIVKLIKTPFGKKRSFDFIKRTSHIRVLAFGAFLVSIPIFFTGVILYTFVNFDEVPALVTSIIIGIGIIFCGVASVQNVYLWQWEKTKASQDMRLSQQAAASSSGQQLIYSNGHATASAYPLELSTLV